MKLNKIPAAIVAMLLAGVAQAGPTVTQWTFDSQVPDGATGTGTLVPMSGAGRATNVATPGS